jgi:error-prone DNA polymerase
VDEVEQHAADLTALVRGDGRLSPALLDRARAHFPDRLWVDVSRQGRREQERVNRRAADLAAHARVPVLASGDVRHARADGRMLTDALVCLREKTRLDDAGRLLAANAEQHLHPREATAERFADRPEWVRATRAVAERCAFTLENLDYRFPEFRSRRARPRPRSCASSPSTARASATGGRCPSARAASSSASSR